LALELFDDQAGPRIFYRIRDEDGATVTGYDDLPLPAGTLVNNQPRFYDAEYRGEAVRIAAMARPVYRPDARMRVIIQVAETAEPRTTLIGTVWR
ncbi:sensor histidine kinase N-terminal domain-containing protein, partial [Pseudomonas sp. GW460-13]|uniref:sensor histidine kinase N-terminal domain-containing protein n=1 Tax=Pseudomonas sp. GW460-13 TaxID=2070590 RepID=UPI000CC2075D